MHLHGIHFSKKDMFFIISALINNQLIYKKFHQYFQYCLMIQKLSDILSRKKTPKSNNQVA